MHITQRGSRRENIFIDYDDKEFYKQYKLIFISRPSPFKKI